MAKGKFKKNRSKVIFEEETIKKENADQILNALQSNKVKIENITNLSENDQQKHKKKTKTYTGDNSVNNTSESININKKKRKSEQKVKNLSEELGEPNKKKKKKKDKSDVQDDSVKEEVKEKGDDDTSAIEKVNEKTTESKRAIKRKKHAKLLEDKKNKSELKMQQSCLNYISKWKYSRTDWKFEKLKQIWLQQNLFDSSKLPDEFWETILEYFTGSKGLIRDVVLKEALKLVDEEEKLDSLENEVNIKCKRARDIVQNLQD